MDPEEYTSILYYMCTWADEMRMTRLKFRLLGVYTKNKDIKWFHFPWPFCIYFDMIIILCLALRWQTKETLLSFFYLLIISFIHGDFDHIIINRWQNKKHLKNEKIIMKKNNASIKLWFYMLLFLLWLSILPEISHCKAHVHGQKNHKKRWHDGFNYGYT